MELKIRNRSRAMQFFALAAFLLLVYAYAQLGWHLPQLPGSALAQSAARRGEIRTESGLVLAKTLSGKRVYPQGTLAGQVVGMLGTDGGLEGLEHSYDAALARGETITLTLDPMMQAAAQSILARAVREKQGEYGSVVAIETRTGKVLAAASYPPFDPGAWRGTQAADRRNRPFLDLFEPGSTVKGLVVAAAINEGLTTPTTQYATPMARRVGQRWGTTIHDAVAHPPRLTTRQVLRYSSNVGMSHIVEHFAPERMHDYLQAYGFGEGVELPGVITQSGSLQPVARWDDVVRATNAFGQGMSASLLQLTAAYNALANDGVYVAPRLVTSEAPGESRAVLRPQTAQTVRGLLRSVIEEGIPHAAGIEGYSLAGKTGTAQVVIDRKYSSTIYDSVFTGFFPAEQPRVTLAVMVHGARKEHHGSQVAAPIYRDIAAEVLARWGLPPQPVATQAAVR